VSGYAHNERAEEKRRDDYADQAEEDGA